MQVEITSPSDLTCHLSNGVLRDIEGNTYYQRSKTIFYKGKALSIKTMSFPIKLTKVTYEV